MIHVVEIIKTIIKPQREITFPWLISFQILFCPCCHQRSHPRTGSAGQGCSQDLEAPFSLILLLCCGLAPPQAMLPARNLHLLQGRSSMDCRESLPSHGVLPIKTLSQTPQRHLFKGGLSFGTAIWDPSGEKRFVFMFLQCCFEGTEKQKGSCGFICFGPIRKLSQVQSKSVLISWY